LDALGFKGIWHRHSPEDVLTKLRELQVGSQRIIESFQNERGKMAMPSNTTPWLDIAFLSDTVVIAATVDGAAADVQNDWACILLASFASSAILSLGAKCSPAFAYRGCVSLGSFEMAYPFVVGAAVDEAAENERAAEGAIVWFAPSAEAAIQRAVKEIGPRARESPAWMPWNVPLKGGRTYRTFAVTPLFPGHLDSAYSPSHGDVEVVSEQILKTFGTSDLDHPLPLSIVLKRQNTADFLEEAAIRIARSTSTACG